MPNIKTRLENVIVAIGKKYKLRDDLKFQNVFKNTVLMNKDDTINTIKELLKNISKDELFLMTMCSSDEELLLMTTKFDSAPALLGAFRSAFGELLKTHREEVERKIQEKNTGLNYNNKEDQDLIHNFLFLRTRNRSGNYQKPTCQILKQITTNLPDNLNDYLNNPNDNKYKGLLDEHTTRTLDILFPQQKSTDNTVFAENQAAMQAASTANKNTAMETSPHKPTKRPPPPPPHHRDNNCEDSFSASLQNGHLIPRDAWLPTCDIKLLMDSVDSFDRDKNPVTIKNNVKYTSLFGGLIILPPENQPTRSFALSKFSAQEIQTLKSIINIENTILTNELKKIFQQGQLDSNYKSIEFTTQQVDGLRAFLDNQNQKSLSAKLSPTSKQSNAGLDRFTETLTACKQYLEGQHNPEALLSVNFALHNGKDHFTHLKVQIEKTNGSFAVTIDNNDPLRGDNGQSQPKTFLEKKIEKSAQEIFNKNSTIEINTNKKGDQKNGYDCGPWTMYYLSQESEQKNLFGFDIINNPDPNPDNFPSILRHQLTKALLEQNINDLKKTKLTTPDLELLEAAYGDLEVTKEGDLFSKNAQIMALNNLQTPSTSVATLLSSDSWYTNDSRNEHTTDWLVTALLKLNTNKIYNDGTKFTWVKGNEQPSIKFDDKQRLATISLSIQKGAEEAHDVTLTRKEENIKETPVVTWTCDAPHLNLKEQYQLIAVQALALRQAQGLSEATKIGIVDLDLKDSPQKIEREGFICKPPTKKPCLSNQEFDLIQAHLKAGFTEVHYQGVIYTGLVRTPDAAQTVIKYSELPQKANNSSGGDQYPAPDPTDQDKTLEP